MCKRASFLAVYGGPQGGVRWLLGEDSHSRIAESFGLPDDRVLARRYVKIECIPLGDPFSTREADWKVTVDEEAAPIWYEEHAEEWEAEILRVLMVERIPQEIEAGECGALDLVRGSTGDVPWLKKAGGVSLREGATLTAPCLAQAGDLTLGKGATLTAPRLAQAGDLSVREYATLTAPLLKKERS